MIKYVQGDLFDMVTPRVVIPHVCNRDNKWGRGFVIPLMANYMHARDQFDRWYHGEIDTAHPFGLGRTQMVEVEPDVFVANMVAQLYYVKDDYREKRPLYYNALMTCMTTVGVFCRQHEYGILAPKFGSELAGGNWEFIECLIHDIWEELDVTVVEYNK